MREEYVKSFCFRKCTVFAKMCGRKTRNVSAELCRSKKQRLKVLMRPTVQCSGQQHGNRAEAAQTVCQQFSARCPCSRFCAATFCPPIKIAHQSKLPTNQNCPPIKIAHQSKLPSSSTKRHNRQPNLRLV